MTEPLSLQPMTAEQYAAWLSPTIAAYAADKVASGEWRERDSLVRSRRSVAELLPHGPATPDHHLFTAYAGVDPIGTLWLFVAAERDDVFIYDIAVDESRRGRGLGRALLEAAETWSRERGLRTVSLHVFGHNEVARALYESSGYEVTDLSMRKPLR